jgi:hypothetical protein
MSYNGKVLVMGFGLAGNHGGGVSGDGNTFSCSWYLNGADEFIAATLSPGQAGYRGTSTWAPS